MLERQQKLNLGIQYYVPNYKNDKDSIFTAKKWQLVNHIFLLLDFFMKQRGVVKTIHCSQT